MWRFAPLSCVLTPVQAASGANAVPHSQTWPLAIAVVCRAVLGNANRIGRHPPQYSQARHEEEDRSPRLRGTPLPPLSTPVDWSRCVCFACVRELNMAEHTRLSQRMQFEGMLGRATRGSIWTNAERNSRIASHRRDSIPRIHANPVTDAEACIGGFGLEEARVTYDDTRFQCECSYPERKWERARPASEKQSEKHSSHSPGPALAYARHRKTGCPAYSTGVTYEDGRPPAIHPCQAFELAAFGTLPGCDCA